MLETAENVLPPSKCLELAKRIREISLRVLTTQELHELGVAVDDDENSPEGWLTYFLEKKEKKEKKEKLIRFLVRGAETGGIEASL